MLKFTSFAAGRHYNFCILATKEEQSGETYFGRLVYSRTGQDCLPSITSQPMYRAGDEVIVDRSGEGGLTTVLDNINAETGELSGKVKNDMWPDFVAGEEVSFNFR